MPVFSQIYAPMWKCTACTDWTSAAPSPCPPCGRLSCSAASGSERGIITPCPSAGSFFGLVRITWSPKSVRCAPTSNLGNITNSRLPRHGLVSTNESGYQNGRPAKLIIVLWSPLLRSEAEQFFAHSSPIRKNVMRTSCILAREAPWT